MSGGSAESRLEPASPRSAAPVFVVGSPRSGNNFLYHVLLSAGGFVNYRAATQVYNILLPKYGGFSGYGARKRMLKAWLASPYFERTGLDAEPLEAVLLRDCKSGGDFLRIVMGAMMRRQGARRWANLSVEELLYMPQIKREIPGALFVHTVRDGRDAALSLGKKGYVPRLPWDRKQDWWSAAFYWDWITGKCREFGKNMPGDYLEIRYEELVENGPEALRKIGGFIEQDLDYERIQKNQVGTVGDPNTSFGGDGGKGEFRPIGRWRGAYSKEDLERLESLIGGRLAEFGYALETPARAKGPRLMRAQYQRYFALRFLLKAKTPLGRLFVDNSSLHDIKAFTR